jgi:hypothetical protein
MSDNKILISKVKQAVNLSLYEAGKILYESFCGLPEYEVVGDKVVRKISWEKLSAKSQELYMGLASALIQEQMKRLKLDFEEFY